MGRGRDSSVSQKERVEKKKTFFFLRKVGGFGKKEKNGKGHGGKRQPLGYSPLAGSPRTTRW